MFPKMETIRVPLSLRGLFPRASFVGCADIGVADATERSNECGPGVLFAAIPGTQFDGAKFVGEAVERGATALLVERPLPGAAVPQCVVKDVRRAYAELCSGLAGNPCRRLRLAGVTGTNGKTTVTWLIRSILRSAGLQAGLLGTIEYHDGVDSARSILTTPDSRTFSQWLKSMARRGTTHAVVEVSSHALDQGRISGTGFDVAVVTNVTQDHFDYHRDYESYLASKSAVFQYCKPDAVIVLNADDPGSASLAASAEHSNGNVTTFGIRKPADVAASIVGETLRGTRFILEMYGDRYEVRTPLAGRYNVANCLAAAASAHHLGIEPQAIVRGLESLCAVPGRLERIECGQPWAAFVDYAHTPDALGRCVGFLKQLTPGRVFCIFGAGGDRDRTKRPLMARAAAQADVPVVTSDNPRTEHPQQIIDDVLHGFPLGGPAPHVEADRAKAVRWVANVAEPGDCVLIAGKGHETEQIVGTRRLPFDDRQVVREAIVAAIRAAVCEPVSAIA